MRLLWADLIGRADIRLHLEIENDMEDILTIAYEGEYQKDISVLMVTRKTNDGMEIVKVFTEDEADKLYKKLTEKENK